MKVCKDQSNIFWSSDAWILERWYGVVGNGLVWLRIATGGELLSIRY
jgi:hypothetical protein